MLWRKNPFAESENRISALPVFCGGVSPHLRLMEVSSSNHTKAPAFEGISRYKALMAVLNLRRDRNGHRNWGKIRSLDEYDYKID